jgi:hypothetical protein
LRQSSKLKTNGDTQRGGIPAGSDHVGIKSKELKFYGKEGYRLDPVADSGWSSQPGSPDRSRTWCGWLQHYGVL